MKPCNFYSAMREAVVEIFADTIFIRQEMYRVYICCYFVTWYFCRYILIRFEEDDLHIMYELQLED